MPVDSENYQTTNEPWTENRENEKNNSKISTWWAISILSDRPFLWQQRQKYQLSEVLRAQMVFGSPSVQLHWQLDALDSWMGFGCNKMPWL